jgi:SagB-type dehydrogenase family enzyme
MDEHDAQGRRRHAGDEFIRATLYRNMPQQSDQELTLPQPPYELPVASGAALVRLPSPESCVVSPVDLRAAIEGRRSVREYSDKPLSSDELSWLLWATQGVQSIWTERKVTLRTVPSAGCRHPFETYLALSRVDGVVPGMYRYVASSHALEPLSAGVGSIERLVAACHRQKFMLSAAAIFFWTAVAYRSEWRYKERAWRYFFLDAGHVCQNLYLAAAPIGCGVCGIGAFDDEEVSRILGLEDPAATRSGSIPVYGAVVGKQSL